MIINQKLAQINIIQDPEWLWRNSENITIVFAVLAIIVISAVFYWEFRKFNRLSE